MVLKFFTGATQPQIGGVYPQIAHQVEKVDLVLNVRMRDRWRLQPVSQRLIRYEDLLGRLGLIFHQVPVIDQRLTIYRLFIHLQPSFGQVQPA